MTAIGIARIGGRDESRRSSLDIDRLRDCLADRASRQERGQVMRWHIVIPFEPRRKRAQTVARTPNGAPVVSDPDKAIKTDLATFIATHCILPDSPFTGPVQLQLTALMSLPTSISKKEHARRLTQGFAPEDSKDCDNINKLYQDVLQTGPLAGKIWKDDKQVCRLIVEKRWTSEEKGCVIIGVSDIEMLAL